MHNATLNLRVLSRRMLTEAEAAHHCGRPVKRFRVECPVRPVQFPNGDTRWDIKDIDAWLDTLNEQSNHSVETILERLS